MQNNFGKVALALATVVTVLLLAIVSAIADTQHSGTISSDEIWYPTGNVHIISGHMTIDTGATLTIMPGVIVKFRSGISLTVNGSIVADATSESQIVITSIRDDSYGGDTNADSSTTSPAPAGTGLGYLSLVQLPVGYLIIV